MYYIIDRDKRCYDKSGSDTFGLQVAVDCTLNLSFPPNVVEVRNININCAQGGNKNGKVFIDNSTAHRLQMNTAKTLPNVVF